MPIPASVFVPVFVTISLSLLISLCFSLFFSISQSIMSLSPSLPQSFCLSVNLYLSISFLCLLYMYQMQVHLLLYFYDACMHACLPTAKFPTLTILDHPFILLANPNWIFSLYVILVKMCPSNKTVNKKAKETLNQCKDQLQDGRESSPSVHMTESPFLDNRMVFKTKHQETCLLNIKTL